MTNYFLHLHFWKWVWLPLKRLYAAFPPRVPQGGSSINSPILSMQNEETERESQKERCAHLTAGGKICPQADTALWLLFWLQLLRKGCHRSAPPWLRYYRLAAQPAVVRETLPLDTATHTRLTFNFTEMKLLKPAARHLWALHLKQVPACMEAFTARFTTANANHLVCCERNL